jgi:hypothetical protein
MTKSLLFIVLLFFGIILNAKIDDCDHSKMHWKSDKEAIEIIENERFAHKDMIPGEVDSWLVSAHYYSCNSESGFLIVKGSKKAFIHQNVPLMVWQSLKSANSKGGYYNFYIKNKFKLKKEADVPIL